MSRKNAPGAPVPLPPSRRVGLDASTAILLHKAGLLDVACRAYRMVTTPVVRREIARGGGEGEEILRLMDRRGVETAGGEGEIPGEESLFMLFQAGRIEAVFADDGDFLALCRRKNVPHYSSVMVPWLLYRNGFLTGEEALRATARVAGTGRFSGWVLGFVESLWREERGVEKRFSSLDNPGRPV